MTKTEKEYWLNGYQTRANGKHKSLTLSIFNIGIMFNWGELLNNKIKVSLFKLTPLKKTYFNR